MLVKKTILSEKYDPASVFCFSIEDIFLNTRDNKVENLASRGTATAKLENKKILLTNQDLE